MATITHGGGYVTKGVLETTWASMGDDDEGTADSPVRSPDKTVTVTGTFGGATVTIQGSNDGTNWFTLKDAQGNNVTFTSAGGAALIENPKFIRPTTAGGTSTSVTVVLEARG